MATKWWTLVAVCVATFMLLIDVTVVNVALPDIQEDLGSSFTDLQWVVDAYALALAAFLLTAGSLADRLGRRRIFVIGLVVFVLRSEEHTSELQSRQYLVCSLLLEKKKHHSPLYFIL